MITAAIAVGLVLAGLVLAARWAPPVSPDECPLFEPIRRGWRDCPGPCTPDRPLPCRAAANPDASEAP